ncbi:Pre-ATP-grasp domain-containing protein [Rostrohypoxylon terebratum]|nr:Pre-ATP-grasp domain-containing protein [Rostrohypoxylon terebratum]
MDKRKVLVANRGEISVRVLRAAHELPMTTVSVYAEEDRFAGHRESKNPMNHRFGPVYVVILFPSLQTSDVSSSEAYLQGARIVSIARSNGVNLIHPGYGFFSENAEFAATVREAGIEFIGPPTDVLRKMGDKVSARQIACACNVPVIPGLDAPLQHLEVAYSFIARHGYPVVIKASFGGGGHGMRVVHEDDSLEGLIAAARSEALGAFGNGEIFIENTVGLAQDRITQHGCAIQCRISTEVPTEGFRSDSGIVDVCRHPTGNGVRLDHGNCFQGAHVNPFYDPLLVKCTTRGTDLVAAQKKAL